MAIPINVLAFPAPTKNQEKSVIIGQIGRQRFAIHYEIKDLPPATPPLILKPVVHQEESARRVPRKIIARQRRRD